MSHYIRACFLFVGSIFMFGCQEVRLRDRTITQASTVTDLYNMQSLNNLAMTKTNPGTIPYFALPSQGTNQNQRTLQATYTPNWDYITATGRFLGKWLFDKNTAAFAGTIQNAETWQTAPTTNPDKINLLKAAYWKTMGLPLGDKERVFSLFAQQYPSPFDYYSILSPGWYCVGDRKDVPKASWKLNLVGHYGDTYVWVTPQHSEELSRFTLAILNIVTASPKPGSTVFQPQPNPAATNVRNIVDNRLSDDKDDMPADVIKDLEPNLMYLPDYIADGIRGALTKGLPARGTAKAELRSNVEQYLQQVPMQQTPQSAYLMQDESLLPLRQIPQFPYPAPPAAPSIP